MWSCYRKARIMATNNKCYRIQHRIRCYCQTLESISKNGYLQQSHGGKVLFSTIPTEYSYIGLSASHYSLLRDKSFSYCHRQLDISKNCIQTLATRVIIRRKTLRVSHRRKFIVVSVCNVVISIVIGLKLHIAYRSFSWIFSG